MTLKLLSDHLRSRSPIGSGYQKQRHRRSNWATRFRKKFIGPFLVLKAYPDFCTFKLQNCATQKILPSLIHSDRLKLCASGRDELFSKYSDTADTVTGTATTTKNAVTDNTRSLTDNRKTVDNSHTTSLRTNGSRALVLPSVSTQGLSAASRATAENTTTTASEQAGNSSYKQAAKHRKLPVRVFTRSTKWAQRNATGSNTAANASATAATAATNKSPGVEERHASHALTMGAQAQSANTDRHNGNFVGGVSDWYEIKRILAHRRRGRSIFYKIL